MSVSVAMYDLHTQHTTPVHESMREPHASTDLLRGISPNAPASSQLPEKYLTPLLSTHSSLSGDTEIDDELNAIMAESWSAPTCVEESSAIELEHLEQEQSAYIVQALEPCSRALSCDALKDANQPDFAQPATDRPRAAESTNLKGLRHGPNVRVTYGTSLKDFLCEDGGQAPWSVFNYRVSSKLDSRSAL